MSTPRSPSRARNASPAVRRRARVFAGAPMAATVAAWCRVSVAFALFASAISATLFVGQPQARADPALDGRWQLAALGVPTAWRYSAGGGVTVAVLDSGVDGTHPDLAGQVLAGADFVDPGADGRSDPVGHGTAVAALIAGHDDNAGVVGVAPAAKILPVRVLDADNKYNDAGVVARGLRWAVDHGASVVNMSLGGTAPSEQLADALRYAETHDVVVVACTGNVTPGAPTEVWYPAREPGVVAVAGLAVASAGRSRAGTGSGRGERTGPGGAVGGETLWAGSLTGPQTVLTAPAVDMLGARPGGYWRVQGTSFAASLVTATATLIRSRWPQMSSVNVINRLVRTARDLGPAGRDDTYGFGEVDPVAALTAQVPGVTANPLDARPAAEPPDTGTRSPAVRQSAATKPEQRGDGSSQAGAVRGLSPVPNAHRIRTALRTGVTVSIVLLLAGLLTTLLGGWMGVRCRSRYRWLPSGSGRRQQRSTPRPP